MRELTQNEFELASGGHGFTEGGIGQAILLGASVGVFWGAHGALAGGIIAGLAYMVMTAPTYAEEG